MGMVAGRRVISSRTARATVLTAIPAGEGASQYPSPSVIGHTAITSATRGSAAAVASASLPPMENPHGTMRSGSAPSIFRVLTLAV